MIIAESKGNILACDVQTLVCPVNTYGVMGNGLAFDFRTQYPDLYPNYQHACATSVFARQGIYVYRHDDDRLILCMPTKRHWKFNSRLEWIDAALITIARDYKKYGITSLAIPAVGCGKGRMDWEDVYNLIKLHLHPIDLPVTVFLPY